MKRLRLVVPALLLALVISGSPKPAAACPDFGGPEILLLVPLAPVILSVMAGALVVTETASLVMGATTYVGTLPVRASDPERADELVRDARQWPRL